MDIASEVAHVIRRRLEAKDRTLSSTTRLVEDLGADSLALVVLTLALEEHFEIEIEDEASGRIRTLQDAVDSVKRKLPVPRAKKRDEGRVRARRLVSTMGWMLVLPR